MPAVPWTTVKRLASSRFSRLLAIVPVVGWLLVLNDHFAKILQNFTGVEALGSPGWQIYAFHVGLSLFGLGVLIFQLTCPREITLYESINDFVERETALMTRSRYAAFLQQAGAVRLDEERKSPAGDQSSRELWLSRNSGNVITVLDGFYRRKDRETLQLLAWLCLISLVTGAAIATVPSLTTILWSFGRLFELVVG
ncbi:hypothetical protein OHD62_33305 [Mesorhizobium sp. YC-39]|uniref:hypothetical protein n=1 Tax=unclassified Mesorhizobium TaxID=325217 RepID=UPI0021E844E6|nr:MULTISPECIES: hypothetical protein [unclassified Mesorhizobium]MCV3211555.1 hypothetical protein [Mesorhizobium sp. YC-2]MCV3233247.1 hypothetical protein [Mesorhizobium sp. YC-39]